MLSSKQMQMALTISIYDVSFSFCFLSFMQVFVRATLYHGSPFTGTYGYYPFFLSVSAQLSSFSLCYDTVVHWPSSILHLTFPAITDWHGAAYSFCLYFALTDIFRHAIPLCTALENCFFMGCCNAFP